MNGQVRSLHTLRNMLVGALLGVVLQLAAAPNALAQEPFDHFSTGFPLDGAHSVVTCDRCHTGATFQGTNPSCISCHTVGANRHHPTGMWRS